MPDTIPSAFPIEVIRKWLALAQRRKDHLTDLYASGRWRLYYTRGAYIDRLRAAIREVEHWSATERASMDAAIDAFARDREAAGMRPAGRSERREESPHARGA